jgi:hypothetical protein
LKKFLPSRRRLASVGIALATVLGGGLVAAPGAHAAACYYSSCAAKEPTSQGCNDGVTIYYFQNGSEVRWSNICQAMWVRASREVLYQNASVFDSTFKDYYENSSGDWLQYQNTFTYGSGGNDSFGWTAMSPMGTNEIATVTAFGYASPYINTQPV